MGSADATLRRGCERDVLGCEQAFYHEFDQSGDRNASVNGPLDVFRLSPLLGHASVVRDFVKDREVRRGTHRRRLCG